MLSKNLKYGDLLLGLVGSSCELSYFGFLYPSTHELRAMPKILDLHLRGNKNELMFCESMCKRSVDG